MKYSLSNPLTIGYDEYTDHSRGDIQIYAKPTEKAKTFVQAIKQERLKLNRLKTR